MTSTKIIGLADLSSFNLRLDFSFNFSYLLTFTEVIRTRLREEGTKYRSFFQTLTTVPKEEGYRALYRGLTTHLVRQIPNTAIMMCTYELVVYFLNG